MTSRIGWAPSEARRAAVGARIMRPPYGAFGFPREHASMAKIVRKGRRLSPFYSMARGRQVAAETLVEAAFEADVRGWRAPGASNQETGGRERVGDRRAIAIAREYLRLKLRLAVAAHRAVRDNPAIVEIGERRIQSMEGPSARPQRIERPRIEREGEAPIGHQYACRREDAPRPI